MYGAKYDIEFPSDHLYLDLSIMPPRYFSMCYLSRKFWTETIWEYCQGRISGIPSSIMIIADTNPISSQAV